MRLRLLPILLLVLLSMCFAVLTPVSAGRGAEYLGEGAALTLAWEVTGARLAVGGSQGVWLYALHAAANAAFDTGAGRPMTRIAHLGGHTGPVTALAWSLDGTKLATGGEDRLVIIWDMQTTQPLKTLAEHPARLRALAWSADGRELVTVCGDSLARIWDVETGTVRLALPHTGPLFTVDWQGGLIATGGAAQDTYEDGFARVWDAATGTLRADYLGEMRDAQLVRWRPDGKRLMILTAYESVLWDAATGQRDWSYLPADGATLTAFAWSPDGAQYLGAVYAPEQSRSSLELWHNGRIERLETEARKIIALDWRQYIAYADGSAVHLLDTPRTSAP